jgi:bifunctional non-homologous end joining protein LigD
LKETPAAEAAVNILTGIETSPNERVPEPMECGGISWFLLGTGRRLAPPFAILNSKSCIGQHGPPLEDEEHPHFVSPSRKTQLENYRKKRDPARTPEPFGDAADTPAGIADAPSAPGGPGAPGAARKGGPPAGAAFPVAKEAAAALFAHGPRPRFVIQKHWARNMHYDLRLELDGTLKSWAVPKGPSTKAEEKRLAVHVEDHPIEYGSFEGVIPAGNYGAGSVIVWDRGWFGSFKPEDLLEQYERGKMELELFGFKLRGRWTLVRMGKKDKEWLLLKKHDGAANATEAIDRYPESVITGLTVEEMRDMTGSLAALGERVDSLDAPRREPAPRDVTLMLATLAKSPPSGPDWSFEIKYDGVRVLAWRRDEEVRMFGRSGEEITARYPEVTAAFRALPCPQFLLDGEIIADDENGRPSFQRLQGRMGLTKPRDIEAATARVPVRAVVFDCLGLLGHDLRDLPLVSRQEILARAVPRLGTVQRSDHVVAHGPAFLEAAAGLGLEGIVAKRLASRYTGRRGSDWIKVKCDRRQEFVIGGYTAPQGARSGFGALHIGVYDGPKLVYVTKVGTGFDGATIDRLLAMMETLQRATSPFEERSPKEKGNTWVEPRLVCEVRFTEWTRDGGLRHPTFLGMRTDKAPEECRREEPVGAGSHAEDAGAADAVMPAADPGEADPETGTAPRPPRRLSASATAPATALARPRLAESDRKVHLTNLKKVFWPDGATKGDLIGFYETVAPLLLPYLRDRPLVLTRFPDGISGKSFFQKDAPVYVPDWVRTEMISSGDGDRDIRYFVVDDVESLRYVANMATIPLHVWSSRVATLENPDWMILDLDPKEAPFTHVVQVARALKTILDELELPSYVKTTGSTGLHILVPMGRRYTHEETRTFARLLAVLTVDAVPEISTVARMIKGRGGKVYVDFGQNGRGNTIVAPFSVRPLPGAPASCPLRWDEVTARLTPTAFTIRNIPERFQSMDDPMVPVLGEGVDMAAAIGRIDRRMKGKQK